MLYDHGGAHMISDRPSPRLGLAFARLGCDPADAPLSANRDSVGLPGS